MRDIATKVDGTTTLAATDFNATQGEVENIVLSADIALNPAGGPDTNLNMLGQAVSGYANAGATYQDSGIADAYVLSIATNLKPPVKLFDNLTVTFKAGNTNTGASTVNVATLGVKDIRKPDDSALIAGDIVADEFYTIKYNLSNDRFELLGTLSDAKVKFYNDADPSKEIEIDASDVLTSTKRSVNLKKNNFIATVNPISTDDSDSDYGVGSSWFNVTDDIQFKCIDASVGAAIWQVVSNNAAYIKDEKTTGTEGGTFTFGAWRTRDLNVLTGDTSFVSIGSNQMTIDIGTYLIDAKATAFFVTTHKSRLRNITDGSNIIIGSSELLNPTAGGENTTVSFLKGVFTLTAQKVIELQGQCGTTKVTQGFGRAAGFSEVEIYTQIKLTKIN